MPVPLSAEVLLDSLPAVIGEPLAPNVEELIEAAAAGGHLKLLVCLNPLFPDFVDNAVAIAAIRSGSIETFAYLAALIITRRMKVGTSLSYAVNAPNAHGFVEFLLREGADPNKRRCHPGPPIIISAVMSGDLQMINLLLRHNASLDENRALMEATFEPTWLGLYSRKEQAQIEKNSGS